MSSTSIWVLAGQDDIGVEAVVFKPGVLGDHELDLRTAQGQLGFVAEIPAGDPARAVGPDHVDLRAFLLRFDREGVLDELVVGQGVLGAGAAEGDRLIGQRWRFGSGSWG